MKTSKLQRNRFFVNSVIISFAKVSNNILLFLTFPILRIDFEEITIQYVTDL